MTGRADRRTGSRLQAMVLGVLLGLCPAASLAQNSFTVEGVTFSDEQGGAVLRGVTGTGRVDDPFVVTEEITGDEPAILTVRGLSFVFGNRAQTSHSTGFAIVKIVTNATDRPWSGYALELQEMLGAPSPYGDGLSFAQGDERARTIASDRFPRIGATEEPHDGVAFTGGTVLPGETVSVSFFITDNSPVAAFYLIQHREDPVARAPTSGSRSLAATAFP